MSEFNTSGSIIELIASDGVYRKQCLIKVEIHISKLMLKNQCILILQSC